MPTLFQPNVATEILQRINTLQPTTQKLWGKMGVSQMMHHLRVVLELGTGDRTEKSNLMGKIMGPFIKKLVMSEKPYKPNLPTGASFIVKEDKNFEVEKQKLVEVYNKFIAAGEVAAEGKKHPLFGKLTAYEWGFSQWKHFDHHLKQFGV